MGRTNNKILRLNVQHQAPAMPMEYMSNGNNNQHSQQAYQTQGMDNNPNAISRINNNNNHRYDNNPNYHNNNGNQRNTPRIDPRVLDNLRAMGYQIRAPQQNYNNNNNGYYKPKRPYNGYNNNNNQNNNYRNGNNNSNMSGKRYNNYRNSYNHDNQNTNHQDGPPQQGKNHQYKQVQNQQYGRVTKYPKMDIRVIDQTKYYVCTCSSLHVLGKECDAQKSVTTTESLN